MGTGMIWEVCDPNAHPDELGLIQAFVSAGDKRSAAEQFDVNYSHGGGWRKFDGFKFDPEKLTLQYPGDPEYHVLFRSHLRDETILVFGNAWVVIVQKDGTWECSRMD
jgi:hypothetical protein